MKQLAYRIQHTFELLILIAGVTCIPFTTIQAQTPVENLQNGVEIYNALREYEDGLTPKTLTAEQISDVKTRMEKGLALLEKVIKEGNAEQIRAARYFKNNFRYEYLFVLGMKGENRLAYDICKEIERDMTGYSSADFPIRYIYFDKNYSVAWENFAPTQAEFYTGYAEIAFNIGKNEDAVRLNRLALAHPNTSNWLKYISLYKMLDLYEKNNTLFTEEAYLEYALQFIKAYQQLDEAYLKSIVDNKYPTLVRGLSVILDKSQNNVPAALARSGEAAMASSEAAVNEKTLLLFDIAYRNKPTGGANFHNTAETYARKATSLNPAKATSVGVSATDQMALAMGASDCSGLGSIADKYTFWKQNIKASEYAKKRQQCLDNEIKAQKRAQKAVRRSNRNFNVYAGVYLFPLFKSNAKRDYGGVLNFVSKKTAWEFSYLKINQNKENVFDLTIRDVDAKQTDLTRWDGFYAHIQPKFFSKDGMYVGALFGYAQKNFEPLTTTVTRDADAVIFSETFNPKTTQYIAMVNVGGLGLTKGFGFDFYAGIGTTYNQWDLGNAINTDDYTIDNIVLENREEQHFSLIMRVGATIGLNFGRGNLK